MNFKAFLSFERMITPILIKILFWIGLVISAISGVGVFLILVTAGFSGDNFVGVVAGFLLGLIAGVLIFGLGTLVTRIYAEMLIIAFRIHESLTDIKVILENK